MMKVLASTPWPKGLGWLLELMWGKRDGELEVEGFHQSVYLYLEMSDVTELTGNTLKTCHLGWN